MLKKDATKRTSGSQNSAGDKALADLIRISNLVGKDPALVQGGGGNTSVKTADGQYMYIKASGTALKDMNATQGWRRMGLDSVLAIIKDKSITKLQAQTREVEVVNRLLLACDAVYQQYTDTAMFGELFNDQWALQFGAQYALNDRVRLRLGYAWNENPMRDTLGDRIGGIAPPGAVDHVRYIEALFAAIPQDRITGGVSVRDVLPGVDLDLFAGGMFQESQTFGITTATVESYWVGTGITWRFGRGGCEAGDCE